jgi:hypothetical protein
MGGSRVGAKEQQEQQGQQNRVRTTLRESKVHSPFSFGL